MPRIPTRLLRKAHAIDPLLPALLAPCRDIGAAQSELRWLREHVEQVAKTRRAHGQVLAKGSLLRRLIKQRAAGKPLQYMLGTEYFGEVEIRCRPGVLIPRQDTAASVTHLVQLLSNAHNLPPELRLLDLCTGTGCIPLLFRHELFSARQDVHLRALAVELSDEALALARRNVQSVGKGEAGARQDCIELLKADVLLDPFADQVTGARSLQAAMNHYHQPPFWDIVISNPPYISPSAYWKTTTRSVRAYEPKLALVPPRAPDLDDTKTGDAFYPRLLDIARDVEAKIVLLEVADLEQAHRVAQRAKDLDIFDGIEIWRESPGVSASSPSEATSFATVGVGNARSVLCWRGAGASWLGKATPADGHHDAQRLLLRSNGRSLPVRSHTKSLEAHFDPNLFRATSQSQSNDDD